MANADYPGGGYLEGCLAQEENMFRRTDCHFSLEPWQLSVTGRQYTPEFTRLIKGRAGQVYLDVDTPRVCVRGKEERDQDDLGYRWLRDEEIFPFYELRSAAPTCFTGMQFRPNEMKRRICAQFETLMDHGVRHVVFGAFGCGAFGNPALEVARIYKDQVIQHWECFDHFVFAIFDAGYGPDNYTAFAKVFQSLQHRAA
jgi:hypothetical protein